MNLGWPDGDTLVALLGLVMAAMLVARSPAVRRLGAPRKAAYAVIWAVVIALIAAVAARFGA